MAKIGSIAFLIWGILHLWVSLNRRCAIKHLIDHRSVHARPWTLDCLTLGNLIGQVPYDGWEKYLKHGGGVASAEALWNGFTGGASVPAGSYVHTTDEKTAYAHKYGIHDMHTTINTHNELYQG